MSNYSPAGGTVPSSARRIVVICGFLAASAAAFVYYHRDSALDQESVGSVQAVASDGQEYPVARFDSVISSAVNEALTVPPATEWTTVSVKSGQSLSNIFDDAHLPPEDWMAITKLGGDCAQLKRIKAGDQLRLRVANGELQELVYPLDELRTLSVRRGDNGFESATLSASLERRSTEAVGTIENSLFLDGRKAGLNDRMILQFADLFGYDIDFAQDLQEGDRFSVVYEELYKDGKKLRDGDILAAEFSNNGKTYRAVRFVAPDGTKAYYTPAGLSLRKAFIRTPVDFTRISSGFTLHRWHPILNRMRAHTGTDYAAPIGTPVHASGNGKVEFVGQKGGYGNVVVLRHGNQYETIYGHLSRFQKGLHAGATVQQGQVIAFVGMTGLATGPHLHYEFRINGMPVNPEKITLPRAMPLEPRTLAQFRSSSAPLVAALDSMDAKQGVAEATTVQPAASRATTATP
ncbi:OapA family protein [Nevskia soli]|uniref:OapA family protein n=1 Tax=Nevskia soli TaxID=418856 RepID=UPI0009FEDA23|nr:peptidoglycan DD-metalloendopeptidase family protein [Nevskia soli]